MVRRLYIVMFTILALPSITSAQAFMSESGYVEFESDVPLHSFKGTSNNLVGKIDLAKNTVDFYVDLLTLDTGHDKRDQDMYETLEAEEYPFAEFFGKMISDFNPDSSSKQEVTVKGEFKVHGVAREVEITGTLMPTDSGLQLNASWQLLLKDYNIEPPGLLFYKVSNEQDIKIDVLLKPVED